VLAAVLIGRFIPAREQHAAVFLRAEFGALRQGRLWLALGAAMLITGGVLARYSSDEHGEARRSTASPVLRVPFEEQDGHVVPQLVALVIEDGVDEQPQHLGRALAGGGGANDEISEPVEAELGAVRVNPL